MDIDTDAKSEQLQVRVTPAVAAAIRELARREERPISAMVRRLIGRGLAAERNGDRRRSRSVA